MTDGDMHEVSFTVNGVQYDETAESRWSLADFLRHKLRLTGTHLGCEHGVCGACTVLLDGRSVRGCLTLAVQANGKSVETVEGLAPTETELNVLQQAFWENHGLQCGFCTPGMVMSSVDLVSKNPDPSEHEIREWLEGNLCRCTGYHNIVKAVQTAAANMKGA